MRFQLIFAYQKPLLREKLIWIHFHCILINDGLIIFFCFVSLYCLDHDLKTHNRRMKWNRETCSQRGEQSKATQNELFFRDKQKV